MIATAHRPWVRVITRSVGGLSLMALAASGTASGAPDVSQLPAPAARGVDFTKDIKPIMEESCIRCHGPVRPRGGFRLDSQEALLKGGESGVAVEPGNSASSRLIHYVAGLVPDLEMPPVGKGDPLSAEQIALLRAWIDQGVAWGDVQPEPATRVSDRLAVGWVGVSGDASKFREHFWQKEGWFGGFEEFGLQQRVGSESRFLLEGRALFDQSDYRVKLALENPNLGFARMGYQQYRKYYDDSGGYYARFPIPAFDLGRDLHLDIGSFWAELGLTLPDSPRMVLGFEHHFREGEKSLLQWGSSRQPAGGVATSRMIYPAWKEINERVDVVRFDFSHDFSGLRIEDNFRSERYDLESRRVVALSVPAGQLIPSSSSAIDEDTSHDQISNAVRIERQITGWWLASAGYLYNSVEGEAAFAQNTLFSNPLVPTQRGDYSEQILIEKQSQYVNLNSQFGPWQGMTFAVGAQMEASSQHGLGDLQVLEFDPVLGGFGYEPVSLHADLDKLGWEEKAALRFTSIPYTVLYAEGRWRQETYGQYEQEAPGHHQFMRDTDARYDLQEYRTGFNVSPWTRVSLHVGYVHRTKQNDYSHNTDDNESAGAGYSAFILQHAFDSDEVEAKLVVKPLNWMKATLGWQWIATDYHTTSEAVPGTFAPGGSLQSGTYDANVLSAGLVLTPRSRLYCSGTYSYTDTRMRTTQEKFAAVVPYAGTIHSVVASANYAVSEAMDLTGSYSFSRGDYEQDNLIAGLPLGIRYDLHALQAGVTRRFNRSLSTTLQYGFYSYGEPTAGGLNDYTAHAVLAAVHLLWP